VGFASGPLFGLAAAALTAVATALLLAAVYRVPRVRHFVMEGLHRITGQLARCPDRNRPGVGRLAELRCSRAGGRSVGARAGGRVAREHDELDLR
jgi:hypothetical protein